MPIKCNHCSYSDTLYVGEPQRPGGSLLDLPLLGAGEDFENNRLMMTITNWSKLENDGWTTEIGKTKEEMKEVLDALQKHYDSL